MLFCGFSLAIALFVSEAVARLFLPSWAPQTARLTSFWRYDPAYGWAHNPGAKGHFAGYGFDTRVAINKHGFRGPEVDYRKPDGTRYIVVLGDSFVWGFGVEQDEAFTQLLDKSLQPRARVVNLGVSGYSTDQQLLLYRDWGRRYRPDAVVLVFANNDIMGNNQQIAYGIYGKPLFRLNGERLQLTNQPIPEAPWYRRLAVNLASRSYVISQANRVQEGLRVLAAPATAGRFRTCGPPSVPEEHGRGGLSTADSSKFKTEVEADGGKFVLLLVDQLYRGVEFRAALAARGVHAIALDDFTPKIAEPVHIADRLHWNPRGHQLVAQVLLPHLAADAAADASR